MKQRLNKNHRPRHKRRRFGSLIRFLVVTLILLQQYWLFVTVRDSFRSRVSDLTPIEKKWPVSPGELIHKESLSLGNAAVPTTSSFLVDPEQRFLIFRHIFTGQGAGNVMSGLLATHLLAAEFNRTVCVDYPSFQKAFAYKNQSQAQLCQYIQERNPPDDQNTLRRNNYDQTGFSSECSLKERLENQSDLVLYFTGNTYPRWADADDSLTAGRQGDDYDGGDYLHRYYRPTRALLQIVPWAEEMQPPRTVVHLRQADGELDTRLGLDDATLKALGEVLPSSLRQKDPVFLVSNRVDWYFFFGEHYGWLHPPWAQVKHSALHIAWGNPRRADADSSSLSSSVSSNKDEQDLQLWADWYTLARAKNIYHTHSDFSKSAARWNRNIMSWTVRGTRNATAAINNNDVTPHPQPFSLLDLERDFEEEHDVPPLAGRTPGQLKYCNLTDNAIPKDYKESRMMNMLAMAKRRREANSLN